MATQKLDPQRPASTTNGRLAEESPRENGDPSLRRLAVVGLVASVLGAGILTAVLFAAGSIGTTTKVTNVTQQAVSRGQASIAQLDATTVYRNAAPGVVAITSTGVSAGPGEGKVTATGTGFEIDARGDILTASHVVDGASSVTVRLQNGATRRVRLLGLDRSIDTAVLQVDSSGLSLQPLALGSSKAMAVGNPIAVIGDPFGFNRSLSTGVISGLDRTIPAPNGSSVANAIQTDAAIDPGNSGGPVLDAQGRAIGITDQIATGGSNVDSSTGVGFAIPIDPIESELSQLERGAHVSHAFLGAGVAASPTQPGALVGNVAPGSPAMKAGLREGDVITAVGASAVRGPNGLVAAISAHRPGARVTLTVQRGSNVVKLTVTLGTQPS
jgi:S1-C subfamily serine protease